jgi:hypothetical protein
MLSRARAQLVIVGDFEFFSKFHDFIDLWRRLAARSDAAGIGQAYGFWADLLGSFDGSRRIMVDDLGDLP